MIDSEKDLNKILPPIVDKILAGDSDAREEFVIKVMPFILMLMVRHSHVVTCPESTAGWIAMKVLMNLHKLDRSKPIAGYIVTTTNNYCIDLLRASRRAKRWKKSRDVSLDNVGVEPPGSGSIDEGSIRFYIEQNYNAKEAEIITLFYVDNYNTPKIAEMTGHTQRFITSVLDNFKEVEYNR